VALPQPKARHAEPTRALPRPATRDLEARAPESAACGGGTTNFVASHQLAPCEDTEPMSISSCDLTETRTVEVSSGRGTSPTRSFGLCPGPSVGNGSETCSPTPSPQAQNPHDGAAGPWDRARCAGPPRQPHERSTQTGRSLPRAFHSSTTTRKSKAETSKQDELWESNPRQGRRRARRSGRPPTPAARGGSRGPPWPTTSAPRSPRATWAGRPGGPRPARPPVRTASPRRRPPWP